MLKQWRHLPGPIRRIKQLGTLAVSIFTLAWIAWLVLGRQRSLPRYFGCGWFAIYLTIPMFIGLAQQRVLARARRAGYRLCPECEYPLDLKNPKRTCPECGRPFNPNSLPRDWLDPRPPH